MNYRKGSRLVSFSFLIYSFPPSFSLGEEFLSPLFLYCFLYGWLSFPFLFFLSRSHPEGRGILSIFFSFLFLLYQTICSVEHIFGGRHGDKGHTSFLKQAIIRVMKASPRGCVLCQQLVSCLAWRTCQSLPGISTVISGKHLNGMKISC